MSPAPVPDQFYRAFEDRYRGSRELIKQRLCVYLPFVTAVAGLYPPLPVLDLGCGRGEWLELLLENKIAASGVDTDEGMLTACRERGLTVDLKDAIEHLNSLSAGSLLAVTGFHIAEHLPFDSLQALFAQARRVIVPGGLLILETPNPENLLVGAANFYIDPSHHRPLPSQLLAFLAEHHGFSPVKVMRLQEESRLAESGPASLYDVLGNVSPDFAIVAQSPVTGLSMAIESEHFAVQLCQAFEGKCGISLLDLANRFDAQLRHAASEQLSHAQAAHLRADEAINLVLQADANFQQLDAGVLHVKTDVQQAKTHIEQVKTHVQQVEMKVHQVGLDFRQVEMVVHQVKTHVQQVGLDFRQFEMDVHQVKTNIQQVNSELRQLNAHAQQLREELIAVYASHSWRITGPLRWLARLFKNESGKS